MDEKQIIAVERFTNEPLTDFSRSQNQQEMRQALQDVQERFGEDYALVINGKAIDTRSHLTSRNPSRRDQIIGTVACASADHANQAVESARRASAQWRKTSVNHRAEYVELMGQEMRRRRFELAAWIVSECGKPWKEADGDVAEAIDFCTYYSQTMRQLTAVLSCDYPGEENRYSYRPRGVAVIIAPWNFPLAILTGMTAAALVTGNTVVIKPAEQSSIVAAKLMEIGRDAGIPTGVMNFLPGHGEEVGPVLVGHPDVDLIAFTGSRAVGLEINRLAAVPHPQQRGVKQVIAEMGGKNSIIVDDDADLDDAVQNIMASAYGYAGQKCSACSRVIAVAGIHDQLLERLRGACESLITGPADDPAVDLGPVIDEEAFSRINDYIAIGKDEALPVVAPDLKKLTAQGYFIGPHLFANVEPESRLAQDEIFGPVLAVLRARNFDQALQIANGTQYALTGGVFSRSPANLRKAQEEFAVGNLYLNRGITGATVQRQPFGGFKMSGIGTKAGGPDALLPYLIPVTVTENTVRRGFAPASSETKKS